VPNFFRLLVVLFLLFVVLNVYLYQRAITSQEETAMTISRPVTEALSWLLQAFPSSPDQSELRFIAARFAVALFCLSLLMVPLLVPPELLDWWDRGLFGACWAGIAIVSVVCFDVFDRIERAPKQRLLSFYGWKCAALAAPLITLLGTAWASEYRINTAPMSAVIVGAFCLALVRKKYWVALLAVILGLIAAYFHDYASDVTFDELQVAERFGRLTTAPSPLLVVIAISYALHVWSDCGLRRAIRLRDRPLGARIGLLDAILAEHKPKLPIGLEISLAAWFGGVSPAKLTLFFLIAVLAPLIYIGLRFLPTLEGRWVDGTLFFGLFAVYLASSHALIRLAWTWINLRYVLRELEWHPMVHAFSRLSDRFRASLTAQVYTVGPADGEYRLAKAEQAIVARDLGVADVDRGDDASWRSAASVAVKLKDFWKSDIRAMAPDQGQPPAHSPLHGVADPKSLAAEDSLALHISLFVREMYVHLFAHLAAVIASIVCLVLAVTIYPFQAQRLMLTAAFVVAALSMGVISWALIGMERDNILSRLAGSTPGKINWTPAFFGKLAAHIGAPVLVLLASQFPSIRILVSEMLGVVSLVVR
jgi:hypothetical protein